jgi:arsenate reductase
MPVKNVLFLCTGNSARSILGEAILNRLTGSRFHAYSAGSRPVGQVNPGAIELLRSLGYVTDELRSKSWDEFAGPEAPAMDFVITVCNNAAGETCPVWPGHPATEHWDIEDPAGVGGTDEERRAAFETAYVMLVGRIRDFVERSAGAAS